MNKLEQIKTHLSENKTAYILGGSVVVVGIAGGFILGSRGQISISNPAMINYKPIANTVQVQMTRPGPKAFVVQCIETQEVWPSIRQAAKDLGIDRGTLAKHLAGEYGSAAGKTFTKVAEI